MLGNHPLGLYEKALSKHFDWEKRLETAKELGFDFVEISIDEDNDRLARLDWTKEQKLELLKISRNVGIGLRSMCLSGHRRFPFGSVDAEIRKRAYEIMKKAILFADFMGIRVIQLAGYDVYYEKSTTHSRIAFMEGLMWASKLANKYGVMLAMEIMDTDYMNSISKNNEFEKQLNSPWYSVYPDIGNLTAWGNDIKSELASGIGSIVGVHLKETLAVTPRFEGKFKCVPFGIGCVDFVEAFMTLEELGYSGPYMIEMWTDENGDDVKAVKQAKAFIESRYKAAMLKFGQVKK